jgi:hypothetical protein
VNPEGALVATTTGERIARLWEQTLSTQPAPPLWLILLTGLLAAALVAAPPAWAYARHALTVAHEGGHGLVALLTGRRLAGIRLHSDTSGLTVSAGRPRGPGMIATTAAGYPAPALLALAAAAALDTGRVAAVLGGALALLAAMLLLIRNLFGALVVLLGGGILYATLTYLPQTVQTGAAYLLVWFLLLGAPRTIVELQRHRRAGLAEDSDADQLARLTWIPGIVWIVLFAAVTLTCLLQGAVWLLTGPAG